MNRAARFQHSAGQESRKRPESAFQDKVLTLAKLYRWDLAYHTHDSRRSDPGFPDLVLVRGSRIVFAELKAQDGRVRPDQTKWWLGLTTVQEAVREASDACRASGFIGNVTELHGLPAVGAYIWRPSDLAEIAEVLR